ncbi:helix-turn-helix domain-containing protein [Weissella kandleri]|uniref:helix-turn-helix domain-containing protein n=1 Tax=Weissella kandleri TaxID=1616 RepID=UPI00387ED2B1
MKNWRNSKQLSFSAAAVKSGISETSLFEYEQNKKSPSPRNVEKLVKVLGVSLEDVFQMRKYDENIREK